MKGQRGVWRVMVCLLWVAVIAMVSCAEHERKGETQTQQADESAALTNQYGPRTFNSELALTVRVETTEHGRENVRKIGETPAPEPLEIPACDMWWVEPRWSAARLDWTALADEIRRKNVPGLKVPDDTTASHLAYLEGLKNLGMVSLRETETTDDALAHLEGLANLQHLDLWGTEVTDDGLRHLEGLTNLRVLILWHTEITDHGLAHVERLTKLRELYLPSTEITDDGLRHLEGLKNLRSLGLVGTEITDDGLAHLEGLENLRTLLLGGTEITDEGLKHLEELTGLRGLLLYDTNATEEGVRRLEEKLPKLKVVR